METVSKLKKQRTIRRIMEASGTALFLMLLIVFDILKEKSKVVTTIEVTPFLSYDTVQYVHEYSLEIIISAVLFSMLFSLLLADMICSRMYDLEIDGETMIIYNGVGYFKLLVNGEEKDVMFGKGYLETRLKSGTTLVASPQFFRSFHITFSDNRPAIDL